MRAAACVSTSPCTDSIDPGTRETCAKRVAVDASGELTKDSLKTVLQADIDAFAAHVAKHHG